MRALSCLAAPALRRSSQWRSATSRRAVAKTQLQFSALRSLARFELGSSAMASAGVVEAGNVEADFCSSEGLHSESSKAEDGAAAAVSKWGAEFAALSTAEEKSEAEVLTNFGAESPSGAQVHVGAVAVLKETSGAVKENSAADTTTIFETEREPLLIDTKEETAKSKVPKENSRVSNEEYEAEAMLITEAEPVSKSEPLAEAENEAASIEDGEENGAAGKKRAREGLSLEDSPAEKKPLTKSALKKLKRRELLAQKHKEMKAQAKVKKKALQEERAKAFAALSNEEKEAAVQRSKESRQQRQEEMMKRKEKLKQSMEAEQNLVIDLELCDEMNEGEIKSMAQQVMFSYAANGKSNNPVRLTLTGVAGAMKDRLDKIPGSDKWYLHKEARPYLDVFADRKQDLVYLTADSATVLESFDSSKIYIIGGLVDHNRLKGVTLHKAKKQGLATARLPIQENIKLATSAVLTVNQVVEIFLEFLECKDWKQALRTIIPQRKIVI